MKPVYKWTGEVLCDWFWIYALPEDGFYIDAKGTRIDTDNWGFLTDAATRGLARELTPEEIEQVKVELL